MRRTGVVLAAVVLGAVPITLGALGNASFSESVPVRVPPSANLLDDDGRTVPAHPSPTRGPDTADDHGGRSERSSREGETPQPTRHAEATEHADPAEHAEPTEHADPAEPAEHAEPTEHAGHSAHGTDGRGSGHVARAPRGSGADDSTAAGDAGPRRAQHRGGHGDEGGRHRGSGRHGGQDDRGGRSGGHGSGHS